MAVQPTPFLPREELQYVVNCSEFWLGIHSAILYGLMDGVLPNADVCLQWIECGKQAGIFPEQGFIPPDFKIADRITGFNELCNKCKVGRRFDYKKGSFYCNQCNTEYDPT